MFHIATINADPSWIIIAVLAVIQGIAEFLPISSSGHLVLIGAMLESAFSNTASNLNNEEPTLEIILHAGTLGSILVVFWKRILGLLTSDRRVIPLLVVGTIPAAIVGLTIKKAVPWLLKEPLLAGCMLIVTGVMLIVLGKIPAKEKEYSSLSWLGALLIGCFQAFAILPGVSRSGSTILGGRFMGLKNEDSVTFSFLLAIPAILGATVLAVKDLLDPEHTAVQAYTGWHLVAGAAIAFVVGIFALQWLIKWSQKDRLSLFAWWCIPFGGLSVFLSVLGVI